MVERPEAAYAGRRWIEGRVHMKRRVAPEWGTAIGGQRREGVPSMTNSQDSLRQDWVEEGEGKIGEGLESLPRFLAVVGVAGSFAAAMVARLLPGAAGEDLVSMALVAAFLTLVALLSLHRARS